MDQVQEGQSEADRGGEAQKGWNAEPKKEQQELSAVTLAVC